MPDRDSAMIAAETKADLDLLRDAAAEAGRIAMRYFRRDPEVWMKAGDSPVSEADLAADRFLRDSLLAARPDYGWLSEESVDDPARLSAGRTFVVDPIDGTRAFIKGEDVWCVSVAVVENGVPVAGVLECPARTETYASATGLGARCNGVPIAVRNNPGKLTIGGPRPMVDALEAGLRDRLEHVRHVPSLAYRLAMVADGRLHATFIKPDSHDWDIAAAELILREAGGRLFNSEGATPVMATANPRHGRLAAASGALVDDMLAALGRMAV